MAFSKTTRSELRASLAGRLQNTGFWSATEENAYINEALRLWQLYTGYWRDSKSIYLQRNVRYYRSDIQPNALLKVMRCYLPLQNVPLDRESAWSMDNGRPGWMDEAAGLPKRWFPLGVTQIGVHPTPSNDQHNNQLVMEGLAQTSVLTSDTSYINVAPWLEDLLIDYAQHIASFKQGGEEFAATLPLYTGFLEACGRQNEKFRLTSIYKSALGADQQPLQQPRYSRKLGSDK